MFSIFSYAYSPSAFPLKNWEENYHLTEQFYSQVYNWKKKKNTKLKRYMHINVHSSIIYDCQGLEAT